MKNALSILFLTLFLASIVKAETKISTTTNIPDEYQVKESQFVFLEARDALQYIFGALRSFSKLTDILDDKTNFSDDYARLNQQGKPTAGVTYSIKITLDEIEKVGNVGWSLQNIGFHNRAILIEGTLLKQHKQIKELEYELLKLKKGNQQDIEIAKNEFLSAKNALEDFIKTHSSWAD